MTPESAASRPFAYHAFGLTILSDFPLSELAPAEQPLARPELLVRKGEIANGWEDASVDPYFRFEPGGDIMRWNAVGAFRLPGDNTIIVQPAEGADPRLIAFPLLGPVLAFHFFRHGRLVLHASAVEVEGRAFVILGDKGAGKSTLAGALVSAGHRLLSDDLVVLTKDDDGNLHVESAAGQLKLYPDSRDAMDLAESVVIEADLHPAVTKRQHRLAGPFQTASAPLGTIVTIDRGDELCFEAFAPAAGLQTLIRFSYPVRFGDAGIEAGRKQLFAQCADVSTRYPVGRLTATGGLSALPSTVEAIEAQMRTLGLPGGREA